MQLIVAELGAFKTVQGIRIAAFVEELVGRKTG